MSGYHKIMRTEQDDDRVLPNYKNFNEKRETAMTTRHKEVFILNPALLKVSSEPTINEKQL